VVSWLQYGFRDAAIEMGWAAQCLDRKMLFAGGIFLAICASVSYLLLHDEKGLERIEKSIADGLGFLEEPFF
jgi:hypothetical protein